jgi:di/tricarboxylate transporter
VEVMPPTLTLLLILIIGFALMLTNRVRADVAALGIALALGLTGLITPQEVFSGFSRSAVITLIGLFILTHALDRTGITQLIGAALARLSGGGEVRMMLFVMLGGATLSLFMNNIAAAAMLLPATVDAVNRLSTQTKIAPSKVMMPLAFATSLGGMATLLTTANIIVGNALRDAGLRGFGLLEFAPIGIPICLVGMAYMLLIGRRLLPNTSLAQQLVSSRSDQDLATSYELSERLNQVRVPAFSEFVGRTLAQSGIGARYGLSVLALVRGDKPILAPKPSEKMCANDLLIIVGREERVRELNAHGLVVEPYSLERDWTSSEVMLIEVIPAPRSRAVGQTLKQLQFREKFGASVLALWHGGRSVRTDVADLPLAFGDAMLVHASQQALSLLQNDPDFLVLRAQGAPPINTRKAKLAVLILAATLVVGAIEIIPIAQAMMLGALAMVLTQCLTMDEAYRAIEWRAVFVVAGMLPVSIAMTRTGAADAIGQGLVNTLAGFGPMALAAGLLAVTMLLTQVMGGQVTGVVLAPIAISAAQLTGANPRTLAMIVALGCSLTFLTITAHPVNVFVMGAGGYKPSDYPRVGLGLTAVVFTVILLLV